MSVSDGMQTSAVQSVAVNLTDVNDVNPVVTASQSFSVAENSATTTAVGTVLATDGDVTTTTFQNWTITVGNTDKDGDSTLPFAINGSTGAITVNDAGDFDREQTTSFTLSVTVSDGVQTSAAQTVVINLTDVNEFNPTVSGGPFTVAENSANLTSVGSVSGSDGDTTNGGLSYSITGGNSLGIFAINSSTGEITVADQTNLDRELIPSVTLTVQVSDGGPGSARTEAATVTINLIDVNEFDPVLNDVSLSIAENSANGSSIGTLTATDADATKTLSYSITAGNSQEIFAIHSSTGAITIADQTNMVTLSSPSSVSLTMQVSDRGPGTARLDTATVTINVTEVNAAPTGVTDTLTSVAEDSGVRVIAFADLLVNDVKGPSNEIGQTLTITAVSDPVGGTVTINGTNLEFTPTDNFHGLASFTYTLQDDGTTIGANAFLTSTANVTFMVTAVNDIPSFTGGANVGRPGDGVQKTVLG